MAAYVSLVKPSGEGWTDLPQLFEHWRAGKQAIHRFGVANRKNMAIGSTLYIMRTGPDAGLVAKAASLTPPEWAQRLENGDQRWHWEIWAEFDYVPASISEPAVIPRSVLKKDTVTSQKDWDLQSGGQELPEQIAERVAKLWSEREPDSISYQPEEIAAREGELSLQLHRHRRRERSLRWKKLAASQSLNNGHLQCETCGSDLSSRFGDVAERIVEVHHLRPLGETEETVVTTLNDLAIVCPTCHRYIHTRIPPYSLEECRNVTGEHTD